MIENDEDLRILIENSPTDWFSKLENRQTQIARQRKSLAYLVSLSITDDARKDFLRRYDVLMRLTEIRLAEVGYRLGISAHQGMVTVVSHETELLSIADLRSLAKERHSCKKRMTEPSSWAVSSLDELINFMSENA